MTVNPKVLKKDFKSYSQRNELDSMGNYLLEGKH